MASTRASGTNAVRYGTMKDNVLSLTVVLPDGEVIRTGRRARKSSAGYDLTRLFVGSEGTLGIITEVTLRLHGIPEAISAAVCPFPSVEAALRRDHRRPSSPAFPSRASSCSTNCRSEAINLYSKLDLPESTDAVRGVPRHQAERRASRRSASARSRPTIGGGPFEWATQAGGPHPPLAGAARRLLGGACAAAGRARRWRPTSACRSPGWPNASRRRSATSPRPGRIAPILGHVGDGNFHLPRSSTWTIADEVARVEAFHRRLVERALAMEGTCTGEHGVGQAKIKYLEREHDPGALDMMRTIKRALDPLNIMNPGQDRPALKTSSALKSCKKRPPRVTAPRHPAAMKCAMVETRRCTSGPHSFA